MTRVSDSKRRLIFIILITATILSFTVNSEAVQSEPDNAALLYYQAMIMKPESDYSTFWAIQNASNGEEPNEIARTYLQSCEQTIKLVEKASRIPYCNWGELNSTEGLGVLNFGSLNELLNINALVLAYDGKYKESLENIITSQRLANHITNNLYLMKQLYIIQLHSKSLSLIQRILGLMPPDEEILTWLQAQLNIHKYTGSFSKAFENSYNDMVEVLRNDPIAIQSWRLRNSILLGLPYEEKQTNKKLLDTIKASKDFKEMMNMSDEKLKENYQLSDKDVREFREQTNYTDQTKQEFQEILSKTDDQLIEIASQSYHRTIYSIIRIIESNYPCKQKISEIQNIETIQNQNSFNLSYIFAPGNYIFNIADLYKIQSIYETHFNIIISAIEVYQVKAQTGKLPEKLPNYLPKEPFSGEDFIYELTDDGFVLNSQFTPKDFPDKFIIKDN